MRKRLVSTILLALSLVSSIVFFNPVAKAATPRFRLGASIRTSALRGFGARHEVNIDYGYQGGQNLYNYFTRSSFAGAKFAHIEVGTGLGDIWSWPGLKQFYKGLIDASMNDGQKCTISILLYLALGLTPERADTITGLRDLLVTIGPNKPALRGIFLAGEWAYKGVEPLLTFEELKTAFDEVKALVNSYGYDVGFHNGKYVKYIDKSLWSEVYSWGPATSVFGISMSQDPQLGYEETYASARDATKNFPYDRGTAVQQYGLGMHDREFNIPNSPPYYTTFEKFEAAFKGASEAFDIYPERVRDMLFSVMPETFNDVEGVSCPYLEWWDQLSSKYSVRTYETEPPEDPLPPTTFSPPYPYPPYPGLLFVGNDATNLPPFVLPIGKAWRGYVLFKNMTTGDGLDRPIDYYVVPKGTVYPDTLEDPSRWTFMGRNGTRSDGWGNPRIPVPQIDSGDYSLLARFAGDSEISASLSPAIEWIRVVADARWVKVQSIVTIKPALGSAAEGPPWHDMDPERWCGPDSPIEGWCPYGETWTFIAPTQATYNGTLREFRYWSVDDGIARRTVYNATLCISVVNNLTLTPTYVDTGEPQPPELPETLPDSTQNPMQSNEILAISFVVVAVVTSVSVCAYLIRKRRREVWYRSPLYARAV